MASGQLSSFAECSRTGSKKKGSGAYGAVYKVTVDGVPCIAKRLHDILVNPEVPRRQRTSIKQKFHDDQCASLSQLRHPDVLLMAAAQAPTVTESPRQSRRICPGTRNATLLFVLLLCVHLVLPAHGLRLTFNKV